MTQSLRARFINMANGQIIARQAWQYCSATITQTGGRARQGLECRPHRRKESIVHEEFWQARWSRNEIGFHQQQVNPYLQQHWPTLALPAGSRVLVPLCGKSQDMLWLAAQGHRVLGIELAQKAVLDFFAEQGIAPQVGRHGVFDTYSAQGIELWCGDFFALEPADVADCQALYDRAALIALPPQMRARYLAQLQTILAPGCRGLLVTLDYDQARMPGPPFAVSDAEVTAAFAAGWQLEQLQREDVLGSNWKFLKSGIEALHESVYRLERR